MYPLRFRPILRDYLWGGRRLEQLGKQLGPGDHWAESWEVCDHDDDQSVVLAGDWAGRTLASLVREQGAELLGKHHPQPRFPLLFKFLDANRTLSVQVHPNDEQAARLTPPDLGKTEAWVVLDAKPGSVLYTGLKRGFDRRAFRREVEHGTCELCLHQFEPRPGDCVLLHAGTPHAIGAGLLIAEIQQSSDVTYRLYDWNRVGPDGQPRTLHVAEALEVIDYTRGPVEPQPPQATADPRVARLAECEKFVLDRWQLDSPAALGGDDRFHIVAVVSGEATLAGDALSQPLTVGSTALLPAAAGAVRIEPQDNCQLLDAYLPN